MQKQPYKTILYDRENGLENDIICITSTDPREKVEFLHYHNELELGLCISGSGVFYIRNEIYPFGTGDISLIFPGENHIAQSTIGDTSNWRFITIDSEKMFSGYPNCSQLLYITKGNGVHGHILSPREGITFSGYLMRLIELCDEYANKTRNMNEISHITALSACILYEIGKLFECEKANSENIDNMMDSRSCRELSIISPAVNYIFTHYSEPLNTDILCNCCHISPVHLRRLFEAVFQLSPLVFMHKIRIRHTCASLSNTDDCILSIAEAAGYSSISSFNRQFLKTIGMTPSEYRKANRKNNIL